MITRNSFKRGIATLALAVGCANAFSAQVNFRGGLATPVLLADKKQTAHIHVSLTGIPFEKSEKRAPANIAIVLDRSGSMSGDKIEEAKRAAVLALDLLSADDIVSVVTYDDTVDVLVPATRATDKEPIRAKLRTIQPGGSTALFAGVSKGAEELRKFLNRDRVNRVILLSDGLANVGPSSPASLAELGATLAKDGMNVSTIGLGLGYNEDLMSRLALNGGGSHYFAEKSQELAQIYDKELGRALSVVAQEVVVRIECAANVRPVRVLNREANILGNAVNVSLDQIYADSEKYLVLEVELPASGKDSHLHVADVKTTYVNLNTKAQEEASGKIIASFSTSVAEVEAKTDKKAMENVVEQIATEKHQVAISLRDKGKVEEARQVLLSNRAFLMENSDKLQSAKLQQYGLENERDSNNLDEKNWNKQRKSMSAGDVWRAKQ